MFTMQLLLSLFPKAASVDQDHLLVLDHTISLRDGILRFTPDQSYSDGNFATLRDRHAELQLDSKNGTTDRRDTILTRTNWPPDFFKDKMILECGCGAGPDTEILLALGARVVSVDLARLEVAQRNIGNRPNSQFVQASIMDLPFKKQSFDIVFCHRVLQHTPDPAATLDHILQFVKPDGAVFVHSYARTAAQMLRWKYALRPFTKRMDPERLYALIKSYAPMAFGLTNALRQIPLGRVLTHVFIPFLNYRHAAKYAAMDDTAMLDYAIHDTFDALAPPYDIPLSAAQMRTIAARHLKTPFEVHEMPMITLLRTLPAE